jgi:hypothetical protein
MSTYFRPRKPVKLDDLRNCSEVNITEKDNTIYLKNNGSSLEVDVNSNGYVTDVFRFGGNDENDIFPKIEEHLDVSFSSEYDEDYDDYCDEETNVYQIHHPNGSCCYTNKLEGNDFVTIMMDMNMDSMMSENGEMK